MTIGLYILSPLSLWTCSSYEDSDYYSSFIDCGVYDVYDVYDVSCFL